MSAGTRPVIWFSNPASSNVRQLGGDNASLGETTHNLSRTGIPCPRASRDRQRCGVVIDFCRKRSAWRADRRFVGAVRRRSGGLSLFDHLPEHNDRFADQLDAAAGFHPSESPVQQYDAARQYARHFAANNAVLAVDPFCQLRPGRPLSRRRGRIMARR